MKPHRILVSAIQPLLASGISKIKAQPRWKLCLFSFFYLSIILSGYAASRAGNLNEYGGGRWLYYAQSVLEGGIPFLDFHLDQGSLLAYLFAAICLFFGKTVFSVLLGLNLVFPLVAFLLHQSLAANLFRDDRFRYGYLCVVWLLNLHYLPAFPAIAVPAALLSLVLLIKGWKQGDYYRLLWSGLLNGLLLFTDPFVGICLLATNVLATLFILLFLSIPYHRRLLKFLILLTSFLLGITLLNLFISDPTAVSNYVAHFRQLYGESWIWYLGAFPSSHVLFALFFLVFFSHLSLFYFRLDKRKEKLRTFLPLLGVMTFSALTVTSLFYQSNGHHFLFWFPALLLLFFLLLERYLLNAIPDLFSKAAELLRISHLFPKMKSFRAIGHDNFAVAISMTLPSLLLFLLVVGSHPIQRTSVTKYLITSWNATENQEGKLQTENMVYNPAQGIWMDRKDLHDLEELDNYLKLNVRLYEEAVFLPQPLDGLMIGFSNPSPFYSVENAFSDEYAEKLMNRWQLFKPSHFVMDLKGSYVHHSEDFLLQRLERFVEQHYLLETQIEHFAVLRLREKELADSPYQSLNHEKSEYSGTTLLMNSTASFPLAFVAAVDIAYTLGKPDVLPTFLSRPFLQLHFFQGEKEVAVKHIAVPFTRSLQTIRVKLRDKPVAADRVTLRVAGNSYTLFKPQQGELRRMEVLALKPGFQSFAGIGVSEK